ncbi:unnamed protein product [Chironomus riparius]|uniref:UDP-glucuronosyltransferase n=1 Tax=Chironomus riparius TaxID=315576 RepID=A0A9N9S5V4_9DIPT|nr:unnamed protein product [Chironomus riparius]
MTRVILLIILTSSLNFICSLEILTILPLSWRSHQSIGLTIVNTLVEADHNVTVIANYKADENKDKFITIHIPDMVDVLREQEPDPFRYIDIPLIFSIIMMPNFGSDLVNNAMKSEELKEFLKSEKKFDVCIMELITGDALLGIAEKFGCSLIYYTSFDAVTWMDRVSGGDSSASYTPNPFLWFTDNMTFKERLINTLVGLLESIVHKMIHIPYQRNLYNRHFPNAKRSFDEMYKNSSITFINNHVSSSFVRPHMPTQIEIGGIHVKPAKPLPSDLQTFLDEATEGVVLFTMGSYIDGTDFKIEQREAFLKAFGKIKEKVLWKYSNETLPNNPGNIKIGSWFPQRDILAHPNVKLFITHGGLLGTTEAIVEGVPLLGIPVFGDQLMNMAKTIARGHGLQVLVKDLSEESISKALNELLTNSKYKATAVEISRRFNDRQNTPQEEIVYWTEYVARHRGAPHLQAASVNINSIQSQLIDVYCLIFVIGALILYIVFKVYKIVKNLISSNPKLLKTD